MKELLTQNDVVNMIDVVLGSSNAEMIQNLGTVYMRAFASDPVIQNEGDEVITNESWNAKWSETIALSIGRFLGEISEELDQEIRDGNTVVISAALVQLIVAYLTEDLYDFVGGGAH